MYTRLEDKPEYHLAQWRKAHKRAHKAVSAIKMVFGTLITLGGLYALCVFSLAI